MATPEKSDSKKTEQTKKVTQANTPFTFVLPTKPTKAELVDPEVFVIFGKPKIGKTTLVAQIPNCLVLNFEDKKQTADGMIMYIDSLRMLEEVCKEIQKQGKPYRYGAIDTTTRLEEMCIEEAERLYMKTPAGKASWIKKDEATGKMLSSCGKAKYGNILFLPNGSGYQYLRQAFSKYEKMLQKTFDRVIFISHVKDVNITKDGAEFTSSDLNLIGKNKHSLSASAHAIAFLTRIGKKSYLNFQPGDDVLAGCKIKRLDGQEILIGEMDEKDKLTTYWEKVYQEL